MCRESGSKDEEGSFMGKASEMLERIIERERGFYDIIRCRVCVSE